MTNEETYDMNYKCFNCNTQFVKSIPKGKKAEGAGGKCPYCDIEDSIYSLHIVLGRPVFID